MKVFFYLELLYTSYSIFLNVTFELLGLSKSLYYLLSSIFEYCGLSQKIPENEDYESINHNENQGSKLTKCSTINSKEENLYVKSQVSFTALFRPSSFETDAGVLLTRRTLSMEQTKEMPQIKIIQGASFETDAEVLLTRRTLSMEQTKEMPQIKIISDADTASDDQIDGLPPRISEKYLNKTISQRSRSVAALKLRSKSKQIST